MRRIESLVLGFCCVSFAVFAWAADPPGAVVPPTAPAVIETNGMQPAEKLPVETFAKLPFVERAVISPDGTHWAGLFGIDGTQAILMMSLFDNKEKAVRLSLPDEVEVQWLIWVNNDNLLVGVSALRPVEGDYWYITRTVALNRLTKKVTRLLWDVGGQDASSLIWKPSDASNEVLIGAQNSIYEGNEELYPAVHRVDVTTGHDRIEVVSHTGVWDWAADSTGTVRMGVGYNDSVRSSRLLYRPHGGSTIFRTVDRADGRKHEVLRVPFMFLPTGEHGLIIRDDEHGMSSIYEYDMVTHSIVRPVFVPESGEVQQPIVSDDGTTLLGVTTSALMGGTHWFDPKLAELQAQLDKALPKHRVSIESISADRTRMLITASAADTPGMVYYYNTNAGVMQRLAYSNDLLGTRRLAPVKVVTYKARDGLDIEALLTLPVGRQPHNLPLIIMPHGGPWGQDTLDYDYWQQFLANRGYAVLQPNYRGSTGYGTEFLHKGHGQLGLAMQDDITDGVKWAVSQGLVDAGRVCIVGGSYGGYAAMWGIAKDPDLYRCAISVAGVASLKREVNDFAHDAFATRYTADWKQMTPDFDAVSPINAVDRIKAPLLLIHGKKDVTVSFVHSTKMYDRMHRAGKTVDMVLLPLADHHYARQSDRAELLRAMDIFLAKYNPAD